jgi:hypothetical protein
MAFCGSRDQTALTPVALRPQDKLGTPLLLRYNLDMGT